MYILLPFAHFYFTNGFKKKDTSAIGATLDVGASLIVLVSSEGQSKKNHDRSTNKDPRKATIWGNHAKKAKLVRTYFEHLFERYSCFFSLVLVSRLPMPAEEMKECVLFDDYA